MRVNGKSRIGSAGIATDVTPKLWHPVGIVNVASRYLNAKFMRWTRRNTAPSNTGGLKVQLSGAKSIVNKIGSCNF